MEQVAKLQLKLPEQEIKFKKENVAPKDLFLFCLIEGVLGLTKCKSSHLTVIFNTEVG